MLMKETRALRWKCTLKFFLVMAVWAATAIFLACNGGGGGGGSSRSSGGGGAGTQQTGELAFVTTTNFFDSASYSTINLRNNRADEDLPSEAGIIESDNDAVYYNNRVYVINRFNFDNITVLDVSDLSTAIKQFSTGNGSNPQDMAFVSDEQAYVSLLGENDLLRVDPTAANGSEIVSRIDLSGFRDPNDSDGIVEAKSLVIVGKYLFVALQLLDNFSPIPGVKAVLAVIDTTDDTLVDADPGAAGVNPITLSGQNPQFMRYVPDLGKIVVSETGSFGDKVDDGIETVDPFTFDAEGFLIDEDDLGGDVGDVVIVDGLKGYVVITDANFDNKVVIFDVETGDNLGDLTGDLPFIPELAVDGSKRVLVPDRTLTEPGIRIFDSFTDTEVTASPIDVGLPPNTVIVLYK